MPALRNSEYRYNLRHSTRPTQFSRRLALGVINNHGLIAIGVEKIDAPIVNEILPHSWILKYEELDVVICPYVPTVPQIQQILYLSIEIQPAIAGVTSKGRIEYRFVNVGFLWRNADRIY